MRFIILAAGVGSRLRPITDDRPKCLVTVNNQSILERLLTQAERVGRFSEAVVITGYRHDQVEEALQKWRRTHRLSVRTVHNERYEETNNGYSLWCARDYLVDGFVLSDGDLVVDDAVIARTADCKRSTLAIDATSRLDEEAMKFQLDGEGRVVALAKTITIAEGDGESIGMCHISPVDARQVVEHLSAIVARGEEQEYYERAFQELIRVGWEVYVTEVGDLRWVEIDDHEDLARASRTFAQ